MEEPAQAKAETENKVHAEAKPSSEKKEAGKVEYFPKYTALLNQVKDHLGPNAYKNVFPPILLFDQMDKKFKNTS